MQPPSGRLVIRAVRTTSVVVVVCTVVGGLVVGGLVVDCFAVVVDVAVVAEVVGAVEGVTSASEHAPATKTRAMARRKAGRR